MAAIYKPRRSQRVVSRTVNAHGFVETLTQGGTTYTKSGLHRDTVGPGLSQIVSTQGESWRLQDPSDDSGDEDEDVMPLMPPVSNTLSSTASLLWGSSSPPAATSNPLQLPSSAQPPAAASSNSHQLPSSAQAPPPAAVASVDPPAAGLTAQPILTRRAAANLSEREGHSPAASLAIEGGEPVKGLHSWPFPALASLSASPHAYCGPLSQNDLQHLLSSPISQNARDSLEGSSSGYIEFFHFIGMEPPPANRQRPSFRRPVPAVKRPLDKTGDRSATREAWKCRACHKVLHVPKHKVSNLGAHLFGTPTRLGGCLQKKAHKPAEPLPGLELDGEGKPIRCEATTRYDA
ncbi:unnamed protein product [Tilletia caries]|nr:unnamed protein product [Tilletia caries]